MQQTSLSFHFWFGILEDAGGSWWWFAILILIWIWLLVFDTYMIQILAYYLAFKGSNNIHVHWVLIWGYSGGWRVLTGVWHLDLEFNMLWIRAVSWVWKCNKYPCPVTSDLEFWRILEVPDCGLQAWSQFGWLLVFVTPMFQILAYYLPFKGS